MTLTHAQNLFSFTWEHSVIFSVVLPFMVGAAFGSFLNVVILRAKHYDPWSPEYQPLEPLATVRGRSFCPSCGQKISFVQNIPAVSWLFLRGKSACCRTPISVQYLVVEWFFGLTLLSLSHFGSFPELLVWFGLSLIIMALALIYLRFGFLSRNLSTLLVVTVSLALFL